VGGGIEEGTGVLAATGVLVADSGGASPFELVATRSVVEMVDDDSFDGDSSFSIFAICSSATGAGSNCWSSLDGSFNVTIKLALDDFLRPPTAAVCLVGGAMVVVGFEVGGGWKRKKEGGWMMREIGVGVCGQGWLAGWLVL